MDIPTTTIKIKNPIRYKRQFETAENSAMNTHKERQNWISATMRQHIPANIYDGVFSKTKSEQDNALLWLTQNKWRIIHNDLMTEIRHEGKPVARFVVDLTEH